MLDNININNFTIFDDVSIHFYHGINVFIVANATGKTHAMKLVYSLCRAWKEFESSEPGAARRPTSQLAEMIKTKLAAVFRPHEGKIGRLVRRGRGRRKALIDVTVGGSRVRFSLSNLGRVDVERADSTAVPASIFLPAREVLSIYPGFIAAYQNRELAFDETYYDLCLALSAAPLRGPRGETASALWRPLGDQLHANVSLERDRFYLDTRDDGLIEAHLAAEGYRKIA